MTVEVASYISELNTSYPEALSNVSQGDDHLRLLKNVLKTQFPNFSAAAVQVSVVELNHLVGLTGTPEQISNKGAVNGYCGLDGGALVAAVNLSGRAALLGQNDTFSGRPAFNGGTSGVNSPFTVDSNFVVANLNADLLDGIEGSALAPKASPALTGTPTAPTAAPGTNTTQIATTAFLQAALTAFTTLVATTKGSWKDAQTGFLVQWGTESAMGNDQTRVVTYQQSFTTAVWGIVTNSKWTGSLSGGAVGSNASSWGLSSFTLANDAQGPADINWIAIGK